MSPSATTARRLERESRSTSCPRISPEDRGVLGGHACAASCGSSAARTCGLHQHYPRMRCPHCGSDDARVGHRERARARCYSFTVVRQNGVPPFNERVPFVVGLVDLDEAGARFVAALPERRARGRADRHAGARRRSGPRTTESAFVDFAPDG